MQQKLDAAKGKLDGSEPKAAAAKKAAVAKVGHCYSYSYLFVYFLCSKSLMLPRVS